MSIISAYRSYNTQKSTFKYWVQGEMKTGLSRVEAEKKANNYSARPGQSEHQLGTAVDLKCSTCAKFNNSAGNLEIYNFIKSDAHKYGFVVSYPENMNSITGYKYEPWHIRYIGVDLATELWESGYLNNSGTYSTGFLKEKKIYK